MPKIYFDACAFIEVAKGRFGKPQRKDRIAEAETCNCLLTAARNGSLEIYTSTLTIAEAVHIGDIPPPKDVKQFFERLIFSGKDGVIAIEPSPFVVERARDLTAVHGIRVGAMDRVHLASAIETGCEEFISIDGKLEKRVGATSFEGVRIIPAVETTLLPDEYKTGDLFSGGKEEK